jgi:hypothetical protein
VFLIACLGGGGRFGVESGRSRAQSRAKCQAGRGAVMTGVVPERVRGLAAHRGWLLSRCPSDRQSSRLLSRIPGSGGPDRPFSTPPGVAVLPQEARPSCSGHLPWTCWSARAGGIAARARHRRGARCGPPDSDPPVPGVRFGPPLDTLQWSAQYTVQVDDLTHGFFELSSTALGGVRRRLPSGLCPGQEGAPPKKLGTDSTITTDM